MFSKASRNSELGEILERHSWCRISKYVLSTITHGHKFGVIIVSSDWLRRTGEGLRCDMRHATRLQLALTVAGSRMRLPKCQGFSTFGDMATL